MLETQVNCKAGLDLIWRGSKALQSSSAVGISQQMHQQRVYAIQGLSSFPLPNLSGIQAHWMSAFAELQAVLSWCACRGALQ